VTRAVARALARAFARTAGGALVIACAMGASAGVATAATTSGAQAVAQAGVLQATDFPAGWKESTRPASSDNELDSQAAKITTCKPFLAFSKANKKNPRAESPNFDLEQSHVNNTVSVYPSVTTATAAMKIFDNARLPACLDKLFSAEFKTQLAKDKKVAKQLRSIKVDIGRLEGLAIGDEVAAYKGTVEVGLQGGTTSTFGLAVIAIRVDNAFAGYSYTADSDISAALQPAIVSSVGRLKAATTAAAT